MRAHWIHGLLVAMAVLCGCKRTAIKKYEFKAPDFKLPGPTELGDDKAFWALFSVCNHVTKDVPEELRQSALNIEGTSDRQDTEGLDCDKKSKVIMPKQPLNNFNPLLKIKAPASLKAPATFAEIHNFRTCTIRRAEYSQAQSIWFDTKEWRAKSSTWMGPKGEIILVLNDAPAKLGTSLNVLDGQNIIEVIYYGRCLQKVAGTEICDKGEEVGRQKFLLNVKIESREINGIHSEPSVCGMTNFKVPEETKK